MREKIQKIEQNLNEFFKERETVLRASLLALLSRQNIFFLGPPGTAKSQIARLICSSIEGGRFFYSLLTKFTTPEEIFGPFSIKALENDEYRRITSGKLPEAHIAFLDEIFKASSSILNTLLMLVNERLFINDSTVHKVPLISLFAASNEIPQGEETKALYDRFALKVPVSYIEEEAKFEEMLRAAGEGKQPKIEEKISLDELKEAHNEVQAVAVPDFILEFLTKIRRDLRKEGIIPSDRKFVQSVTILKAEAWLGGKSSVEEEDLDILVNVLWEHPDHIPVVIKVVNAVANPFDNKAIELLDMAKEIYDKVENNPQSDANEALEATTKLKDISSQLEEVLKIAQKEGRKTQKIETALARVKEWNKDIVVKKLGIEV